VGSAPPTAADPRTPARSPNDAIKNSSSYGVIDQLRQTFNLRNDTIAAAMQRQSCCDLLDALREIARTSGSTRGNASGPAPSAPAFGDELCVVSLSDADHQTRLVGSQSYPDALMPVRLTGGKTRQSYIFKQEIKAVEAGECHMAGRSRSSAGVLFSAVWRRAVNISIRQKLLGDSDISREPANIRSKPFLT
jgi:hypothetical protein